MPPEGNAMATSGQGRINRRQVVRGAAATAAVMTLGSPSVCAQKGQQTLRFVAERIPNPEY
jgi:hypothetical protein